MRTAMTHDLKHVAGITPQSRHPDPLVADALVAELTSLLHDVSCALILKENDDAEIALLDRADALLKQVAAYQGNTGKLH